MASNVRRITGSAMVDAKVGIRVSRATAALPATTASAIFTVTGQCLLIGILGEVTTVIQTQACNTKLTANPTTGTSVDLCGVLDISADAVGDYYGITGTFATAMVGAGAAAPFPALPIVIDTGTIDLSTVATNTGSVKWDVWYLPLEAGASVTAA